MYIPKSFREDDVHVLHTLMQRYNFATLFSQVDDEPFATHLPFMLDPSSGTYGTLIGHFARANPHWQMLQPDKTVLIVFQGAHEYISPSWYTTQETVPTWNYAVIHAYAKPRLIHEPEALRPIVTDLVHLHENAFEHPWDVEYAAPLMESSLKAIVGVELTIDRLEGKYKFNQNRSTEDQEGVIAVLETTTSPNAHEVAAIMRGNLAK